MATIKASGPREGIKNIVLVHGAFADGSGWEGVFNLLSSRGYVVTVVQHSCTSLEDDVAAVDRALDKLDGPAILVGHSYGGAVITQAGLSPRIPGLVYVAAFQPDAGESALSQAMSAPDLSDGGILPPDEAGFVYFAREKFHAGFCADLPAARAAFMAASQNPVSIRAFGAPLTQAAWKTKPCWAIIPTEDKSINPVIHYANYQRSASVVKEVRGASHAVFISCAREVVDVIETAATKTVQAVQG